MLFVVNMSKSLVEKFKTYPFLMNSIRNVPTSWFVIIIIPLSFFLSLSNYRPAKQTFAHTQRPRVRNRHLSSKETVPRFSFLLKFCGVCPIRLQSSAKLIFIFSHNCLIISDVVTTHLHYYTLL